MISSAALRSLVTEHALIQLPDQILLKRFLYWNGIEKELAFILRFL